MKIAITGGIGSGKSAAADVVRKMGFKVASCDDTYARLCGEQMFLKELKKLFPSAVHGIPLRLDRRALAEEIFADEKRRSELDAFTHPRIMAAMETETAGEKIAFYEVPLLFESGLKHHFDEVIVVLREKDARVKSVMKRSNLTEEQIAARMTAQIDYETYDFGGCRILKNDGDLAALEEKTRALIEALTAGAAV
ncbi:MAG: dephospho-CoA kinase [Bacillota bacterium]|nr:MAG: dephospho-CoA kinase [Bacillota bacterium]